MSSTVRPSISSTDLQGWKVVELTTRVQDEGEIIQEEATIDFVGQDSPNHSLRFEQQLMESRQVEQQLLDLLNALTSARTKDCLIEHQPQEASQELGAYFLSMYSLPRDNRELCQEEDVFLNYVVPQAGHRIVALEQLVRQNQQVMLQTVQLVQNLNAIVAELREGNQELRARLEILQAGQQSLTQDVKQLKARNFAQERTIQKLAESDQDHRRRMETQTQLIQGIQTANAKFAATARVLESENLVQEERIRAESAKTQQLFQISTEIHANQRIQQKIDPIAAMVLDYLFPSFKSWMPPN